MAFNFDSGQFNSESTPKRLGNWQVPRWAPTRARPLEMRPDPKPICDINGHFLPGAPRGTSRCFGHYTGTWELPRKITRKVAEELAKEPPNGRFPDWLNLRVQRPKAAAAARLRAEKRGKLKREPNKLDLHDEEDDAQTFEPRKCPFHKHKKKRIQRFLE
nr:protein Flattop isoform X2 [Helicoverpa armigera]